VPVRFVGSGHTTAHPWRPIVRSLVTIPLLVSLVGCGPSGTGLTRYPTAQAPPQGEAERADPLIDLSFLMPRGGDSATPTPLPPALALPDANGDIAACAFNTLRMQLVDETGAPFAAASRIAAADTWLYLLVDGSLARLDQGAAQRGQGRVELLVRRGDVITGRPVQELVDLAANPDTGHIFLLDKAGHIFTYSGVTGRAVIHYRAAPEQDMDGAYEPQTVAITLGDDGKVLLLDTAHGAVWEPGGFTDLEPVSESEALTSAIDLTQAGGDLYALRIDGSVWRVVSSARAERWGDAAGDGLGLSIKSTGHLGSEQLLVVDGLRRTVTAFEAGGDHAVTRHRFAFDGMGLLRDAEFAGDRLYALADGDLYVHPGPAGAGGSEPCPQGLALATAPPSLYGANLLAAARTFTTPIQEMTLPVWPRLYPGASRLYRYGVHQGTDIYQWNAPEGFGVGSPVLAMGPGVIADASVDYSGVTEEDWDAMVEQANQQGLTNDELMARFLGRRVVIDHGGGIVSVYAHLDELAPGIRPGVAVQPGSMLGTVGETGTYGEVRPGSVGGHLHFEIWVNGYYLGEGLTIRETMWWLGQVFPQAALPEDR